MNSRWELFPKNPSGAFPGAVSSRTSEDEATGRSAGVSGGCWSLTASPLPSTWEAALSKAGIPKPTIPLGCPAETSTSAKQGNFLYNPSFPCRSSEAGAREGWRRINFKSPLRHRLGAPGDARRDFHSPETALGTRKNSWQEQLPLSLVELVPAGVSGAWAKLHGAARPALRRDRNHTTGPWGSGKDKTHQEGEEIFPKIQAEAVCPCPISWEKRKEQIGRFSAPEPTGIQNPWDGQCWPALDTQSS